MFREMRRSRQSLSAEQIDIVLARNSSGVLAVHGENGYPYSVPLNYVYSSGKIYFHCARSGHKLDAIRRDPRVCFTVVDEDTIVPEEYTSYFRSVILFGRAAAVEGEERTSAFLALAAKYSGSLPEASRREEVARCRQALIIGISIDHMTGKEAIEYARQQEK